MSDEFLAKVKKEGDALRTKRDSLVDQKAALSEQVRSIEEELGFVNAKIDAVEKYEQVDKASAKMPALPTFAPAEKPKRTEEKKP